MSRGKDTRYTAFRSPVTWAIIIESLRPFSMSLRESLPMSTKLTGACTCSSPEAAGLGVAGAGRPS